MTLYLLALSGHIETRHGGAPRSGHTQSAEHPHSRCLPGAVGSEKAEHLAAPHVEADAVDGGEIAEPLDQVLDHNHFIAGHLIVSRHLFSSVL